MKTIEEQTEKTIEEIVIEKLVKKELLKNQNFMFMIICYKTIVDMMKDYEEKLQEKDNCKC